MIGIIDNRFLEPLPKALAWAKRSRLPDGRLARFYELKTNKPLYFTKEYVLTYDDSDMPTHYAFKVSRGRIERIERDYNRAINEDREKTLMERNSIPNINTKQVQTVINALDEQGRWTEQGSLRHPENRGEHIETEILSCRTFNRNLTLLARYVKSQN